MKIDVHAHIIPEMFVQGEQAHIPRAGTSAVHTIRLPVVNFEAEMIYSVPRRLRDMDHQGVDVHVLSIAPMYFYQFDPAVGLQISQSLNNALAEIVAKTPDRFVAIADLPMQDPPAAARELERAVRDLGLRGAEICTNILGKNLDDPSFAPVWAKMQELDVPFFLHPSNVIGQDRLGSYHLANLIGNPTDTAVAAASLIFGGVLKEFPRLKFYLAHGGGSCPFLRGRWEHGWRVRTEGKVHIERPPSEYLRLLYFDTLAHGIPALNYLVETMGADRVLLGSDYPFDMRDDDPVKTVASLPHTRDADKWRIFGATAQALFRIG